jgi:putative ABC transport system permease protein
MLTLWQDLRFAARSFLRTPRFTVPAVLTLALGIGATSAIFSVVRGVILKPLPYGDPDRIVVVWENNLRRNRPRNVIGAANFVEWRARSRSFANLGMAGPARLNLVLGGEPTEVNGMAASSDVFPALGAHPAIGRGFTPAEDEEGRDAVMVVSHEFWQTRLGGRADVLEVTLEANGRMRRIVGVLPPGFTIVGQKADFLVPYGWTMERLRGASGRGSSFGLARLRDGVTFSQAADEMTRIASDLEREFPQRNAGWSVTLVPVHEQMVDQIRPALLILAGAVLMVLLVACVNVANLLLARGTVRQRELGIRTALGAGRARLVRQMLSESLLLAAAGGAAGMAIAVAFHRGLLALVADRIPVPRLDQVALDGAVLSFTMALALGTGLLFGLLPSVLASAMAGDALREGGRHGASPRSRRALTALIASEVALSLVLLTGAGLLIRSFIRLQSVNPGFRAEGLLTARVQVPAARYPDDRRSSGFYTEAVNRISTLPGVQSAAAVSFLPLAGPGIGTSFWNAAQPAPAPGEASVTDVRPVTPGFFRTMGIPHRAGRDFTAADAGDSPLVAIVSDTLVRVHLSGEDPLGKRLHVNIGRPGGITCEIVGVVGDVKLASLDSETRAAIYLPHTQLAIGVMTFVVRTGQAPASLAGSVAGVVHALDPGLALADVRAMDEVVDATLARPRVVSVLLTTFAVMALVLAGVGVYGVMAYSVSQRTREMGVRMALGATPQSIVRLVLGESLRTVLFGVAMGLVAAVGATLGLKRLLAALLFQTEPRDPWTFAATALLLLIVAAMASYVPARRSTRVAPVDALRTE